METAGRRGTLTCALFGSPAVSERPVAFRPPFAEGLAFRRREVT